MSSNVLSVIIVLTGILVALLIVLCVTQFANYNSTTRKSINFIKSKVNKVRHRNKIYKCSGSNCKRYYRLYQLNLLKEDRLYKCPHCNKVAECGSNSKIILNEVKKPDKWMDSHIDCFRISIKQYFGIQRTLEKVRKLKEEEEAIKRFEEYNKISVDTNWIENLQKKELKADE